MISLIGIACKRLCDGLINSNIINLDGLCRCFAFSYFLLCNKKNPPYREAARTVSQTWSETGVWVELYKIQSGFIKVFTKLVIIILGKKIKKNNKETKKAKACPPKGVLERRPPKRTPIFFFCFLRLKPPLLLYIPSVFMSMLFIKRIGLQT